VAHPKRHLQQHKHWGGRSVVLAVAVLGLVGFLPVGGLAQSSDERIQVEGEGLAVFDLPLPTERVPACRFAIDASGQADEANGTFDCEMSDEATVLGVPIAAVAGVVDAITTSPESPDTANLSGLANVTLRDTPVMEEPVLEGVAFSVESREGEAEVGGLRLWLMNVLDGHPGDTTPDDGHYDLWAQIVVEGDIRIETEQPEPEPDPEPSPEPDPEPTPEPDPDPGPDPTPGPDPGGSHGSGGGGSSNQGSGAVRDVPFSLGGTSSTARLMAVLAGLYATGTPSENDILSTVGPFPVAGLAWWQDDWHAYRCCPYVHQHKGLDIFAPRGTPAVAAAGGIVSQKVDGAVSGLAVEVTDSAGTEYFYAHLDGFAPGLREGQYVRMGEVLGYVGDTGNARGTSSHLHFEVQPGGVPIPPKPLVDSWLAIAESRAATLVEWRTGTRAEAFDISAWLAAARGLADDSTTELIGRQAEQLTQARLPVPLAQGSPVAQGPMAAFAAGMLVILLIGPGVAAGRRQAKNGLTPKG
jgi:murein DD-endopeptidase MepM/ murein hydrolase activator NlpD